MYRLHSTVPRQRTNGRVSSHGTFLTECRGLPPVGSLKKHTTDLADASMHVCGSTGRTSETTCQNVMPATQSKRRTANVPSATPPSA
jgi:hypothetical protein